MRLPAWYVVASDGSPEHRDLAVISATVLRHVDPACEIGLMCDRQTAQGAASSGVALSATFDRVEVRDAPEALPMHRSRSLKLRLRLELSGDLLYVDSDTLAVRPLAPSWPAFASSVMIAYDYHPGAREHRGPPDGAAKHYQRIGWPYPVPRYFNGGVIAWRDDKGAHEFAERWYRNWQYSVQAGVPLDQPALGHTDRELGGVVTPLPPRCNAQVNAWAGFARGASLWHFWLSQVQSPDGPASILDHLLARYRSTGEVDMAAFEASRRAQFPWVRSQGFLPYVHTGNYWRAAREVPDMALRFLGRRGSK